MKKLSVLLLALGLVLLMGCEQPTVDSTPATYTVTYDANGGSGTMSAQTFTAGTAQNLNANAFTAPEGNGFVGWATTETGDVAYANSASYTATANTTLYAKWAEAPTEMVVSLPAGTGTSDNYVLFGDYPKTIKASSVTVGKIVAKHVCGLEYYLGSDRY